MAKQKTHVIIGGGAAGIFAAIACKGASPDSQVIVLEKTNQLLSKVRISGGGRCNVTHYCFDIATLVKNYPRGSKELIGPFHVFQPKDTIEWFSQRGVELKVEKDGRMFPTTDSSQTIIDCLLNAAASVGVVIQKTVSIQSITKEIEQFIIEKEDGKIFADTLTLATGSSNFGHEIASKLGHTIVAKVPSLFTFNIPTSPLLELSGISVPNAILSIEGTSYSQQGPLLLTHWGFSGPAALKLSAWAARDLFEKDYKAKLIINWTGEKSKQVVFERLLKREKDTTLPLKLYQALLTHINIDPKTPAKKLSNKQLEQIANKLFHDSYQIEGKTTNKQEFVTAGGIELKEVDFKTMQSKIVKGLYFAGEILNIDGVTGGFNFQNAWTTAFIAGNHLGSD